MLSKDKKVDIRTKCSTMIVKPHYWILMLQAGLTPNYVKCFFNELNSTIYTNYIQQNFQKPARHPNTGHNTPGQKIRKLIAQSSRVSNFSFLQSR